MNCGRSEGADLTRAAAADRCWQEGATPLSARTATLRRCGLGLLLALLAGCHAPPPGLTPLEQPSNLQPAPPRVNSALPPDRTRQREFVSPGRPASAAVRPEGSAAGAPGDGDVTLNFVDTDIREIVRTVLGTTLKVSYTIDPNVHGTGSFQTGRPLPRSALVPVLETLLNQNGATIVEKGGIYDVMPLAAGAAHAVVGAGAPGAGTQVVSLRYAAAPDLVKALTPYVSEGGKIAADAGRNAVIISGDAPVRQTLADLVHAFDIDVLAGQSYALFPAADGDPEKLAKEFEKVLQAEGGGTLAGVVRVLPMSRANAVLVASAQPRYLDAARRFFGLANKLEDATAREWHVYYVQNGQSADLETLLQRAFTPGHIAPTQPAPGTTPPGARTGTLGVGGAPSGAGGTGGVFGGTATSSGGLTATAGTPGAGQNRLGTALGAPAGPGPAQSAAIEPLSAPTGGAAAEAEEKNRIRIIANLRNNALLIYATPSEYSVIEGMLRKIDIVPLQVLIEATIAEVTLNDALQYGTQFFFRANNIETTLGSTLAGAAGVFPAVTGTPPLGFAGFVLSRAPNVAISALANISQVKVLSAPQVMVLDNQPARLLVGQRVPVLTGTATSTLTTGAPVVNSVDYQDTGVILQVTPQVNSGGLVTLEIGQEVSDVGAPAANTVAGSPTFDDRVIQTRVSVQDGQTVGMAGLIQDSDTQGNSGIPFLKDIPVLGTLASTQNNSRARKELLVLITPHVIRDQKDARALTEDLRSQLINAGLVPQQLDRRPPAGLPNPNGL